MTRLSVRRGAVGGIVLLLGLLAVVALAAPAGALTARFTIDGDAAYTRSLRVTVGDGGWTPFFRPAVVVWDGGSIIEGHGATTGHEFPAQTLAVLPHAAESYVSSTGGARIADMLVDAPFEVDPHYRANADLDLCVVLAGGADLYHEITAAEVYQSLKLYCAERRAAGFRVVVLSVLPRNDTWTFEPARLAFNAMLRDTWDEFADGFADIAADPRIGDAGDNLNHQFYASDALHPNAAGCAVMAGIAAPVLEEQPWRSSRCEMHLREAGGEWGPWRPYGVATTVFLAEGEGPHVIEAEYRLDGGAPIGVYDDIFVDTVRPEPQALRDVAARRGRLVRLPFRVDDAQPCGSTCTVTVTVTTRAGRVLRTFVRRLVPVGVNTSVTFTGGLGRGGYRYVVSARDAAGNPTLAPDSARLSVR